MVASFGTSSKELIGRPIVGETGTTRVATIGADQGQSREGDGDCGSGELHLGRCEER